MHAQSFARFIELPSFRSSFNKAKRDEKQLEPKKSFMDDVTVESTNHFGEQLLDIDGIRKYYFEIENLHNIDLHQKDV